MKQELKLYLWDSVYSLSDHTNGLAFALAKSKREAIRLIIDDYMSKTLCRDEKDPDVRRLKKELTETKGRGINLPFAYWAHGSA